MGLDKPPRSHFPDYSGAIMRFTSPLISAGFFAALQRARWNTISDSSLPIYASITLHGRLQRDRILHSPPSSSIDTQNFTFLKFNSPRREPVCVCVHNHSRESGSALKRILFIYVRHDPADESHATKSRTCEIGYKRTRLEFVEGEVGRQPRGGKDSFLLGVDDRQDGRG